MKTFAKRFVAIVFSLISPWLEAEAIAAAAPTKLRVAIEDSDNRPYEYQQDGQWTGYHIEVIENVAKKLGWNVVWIPIVWTKAYNVLYTDQADAVSFLMRTPIRPEPNILFNDDNILNNLELSVYARKDSPKINIAHKKFSSLANHHTGVVPGSIADRWFSIVYPEVVLNRTPQDSLQLFQMLDTKRYDFAVGHDYSYEIAIATNPRLKGAIVKLKPHLTEAPAYIAFQNTDRGKGLSQEFGEAFKAFRGSKEFKELKAKYNIHN